MENKKDDNGYNNESYLDKRVKPDDLQNIGVLDEIGNKTEEKSANPSEQSAEIKSMENIDDSKSEDDQKEMHPEIVRKKNKDFTKPLILGIIVLIIIGIVAAYFLLNTRLGTQTENPQQIIKSSMQEMQKVKTYSYDGIMEFDIKTKEGLESFSFDVELSGKADQADINNIKSFNNLKALIDISTEGGSQELSFDLDSVQLGQKKTYFKLNDFDLGAIGMMMGPEVSSLKEKWYELDLEELEKLGSASSGNVSDMEMATYDMNKIMELYNKYELLEFQEDLGDTKIGQIRTTAWIPPASPTTGGKGEDIDVYHYKAKLDGIALINFYVDVMEEMVAEINSEDRIFYENFREIKDDIKRFDYVINDITDNINVEIWIGKEDKLIYRTKIDGKFDKEFMTMIGDKIIKKGDNTEEKVNRDIENMGDSEIAFNIDVSMFNFNQPVEINEPEEVENLMKVLERTLGEFMRAGVTEEEIDTDADGLPDYMENIYGSDPNNPDTDGDGYKDGEEVESGYDPLISGNAKLDYDKLFKTQ